MTDLRACLLVVVCALACRPGAPSSGLVLGDATVYELVNRRFETLEKPARALVLHTDGTLELINDKTDRPWMTFVVKTDGTVLSGGKPLARITEHAIVDADNQSTRAVLFDGDVATVVIEGTAVKVVMSSDGTITSSDRPGVVKWRIEAKDPAVRRTAFRALGLQLKAALD